MRTTFVEESRFSNDGNRRATITKNSAIYHAADQPWHIEMKRTGNVIHRIDRARAETLTKARQIAREFTR